MMTYIYICNCSLDVLLKKDSFVCWSIYTSNFSTTWQPRFPLMFLVLYISGYGLNIVKFVKLEIDAYQNAPRFFRGGGGP